LHQEVSIGSTGQHQMNPNQYFRQLIGQAQDELDYLGGIAHHKAKEEKPQARLVRPSILELVPRARTPTVYENRSDQVPSPKVSPVRPGSPHSSHVRPSSPCK